MARSTSQAMADAGATADSRGLLRPLSEQMLTSLPGPRVLWIVAWALVPWGNAGANVLIDTERSAIWEQSRVFVVINYAALSLAIVISLVGAEHIARRLEALRSSTSKVFRCDACAPFRSMNNVVGPVAVSAAAACVFAVSGFVREGVTSGLLRGVTWFVLGIAIWSFLWTYASLQLGLHRLGGERLHPSAARGDPSLGLRPLGDVAFMGLWMLLALLVPVVVTGLSDIVGVGLGLVVLSGGLAMFFLSLWRLHRQMAGVKTAELTVARDLYAQAYEPVRASPTLEALEQQRAANTRSAGALASPPFEAQDPGEPFSSGTYVRFERP